MITKAEILKLPKGTYTDSNGELKVDNKFEIYVPIFCSAGESRYLPTSAAIMKATLCYNPGVDNGYRVGDIVFISFENNEMGQPVILGKLYLNDGSDLTSNINGDELNISSSAKLPINTQIGNISGDDIAKLFRLVDNAKNILKDKQETLVSGENIKTLNGQSLLGEGNIQFYLHDIPIRIYSSRLGYDMFFMFQYQSTSSTQLTLENIFDIYSNNKEHPVNIVGFVTSIDSDNLKGMNIVLYAEYYGGLSHLNWELKQIGTASTLVYRSISVNNNNFTLSLETSWYKITPIY